MLSVRNVHKSFGATRALAGVNLTVRAGQVLALLGENGAGKSTLMNVVAGGLRPDSGDVALGDKAVHFRSPAEARAGGVALIHQELLLCPQLTVQENLLLGLESSRAGFLVAQANRNRAVELLSRFPHLKLIPEQRVADLPVAARQIVEIARALAANAQVLLMDEPTSSLGADDAEHLHKLIKELSSQGRAIVYISHFLEEVRRVASHYAVLRDGASVAEGLLADATDAQLVSQMVGRDVTQLFPVRNPSPGPVMCKAQNLATLRGLHSASLEVRAGEIVGIAGLMGSGRTELMRAMFGLDDITSGDLSDGAGNNLSNQSVRARMAAGMGFLSEDRKGEGLALNLSIADNTTLSSLPRLARNGLLSLRRQYDETAENMRNLGVKAQSPLQPVGQLSGGNQQKVALARLAAQGANIWLLDEPTRGVDIGSKVQIYEVIAAAAAKGAAVVMTSSYLPELLGVCDRIGVMCKGRLVQVRATSDFTAAQILNLALGASGSVESSS